MRKVNWPAQQELSSNTVITIIATFIISGFIFLADQVISEALRVLFQ